MKLDAKTVKRRALELGADLVGIANIERFEGAPLQCDPKQIMPEAKSMVVVGFRVFRGLLRGIEEGTLFSNYSSMGYAGINQVRMPVMLWEFGKLFEDEGYEALPLPNDFPWCGIKTGTGEPNEGWSRPVAPGRAAPDVFIHMRIAAYCAGLGEIGWSKIFLNPVYGPRVRYGALLTEAELEPDPLVEPGTICDRCMCCVRDCAGKAISATESVKVEIAGKTIEWGKLDEHKCSLAFQGGVADVAPDGEKLAYADYGAKPHEYNPFLKNPSPRYEYGRAIEGARGCVRACMIHLEQQGKLSNKFKTKFRRRPAWKLEPLESSGG
jgi:epoxyqueuosine reductase QueG